MKAAIVKDPSVRLTLSVEEAGILYDLLSNMTLETMANFLGKNPDDCKVADSFLDTFVDEVSGLNLFDSTF